MTAPLPHFALSATLVQPGGRMQDLTCDMLFYKQHTPQLHPSGAKP